jgi:hypothetical protein
MKRTKREIERKEEEKSAKGMKEAHIWMHFMKVSFCIKYGTLSQFY